MNGESFPHTWAVSLVVNIFQKKALESCKKFLGICIWSVFFFFNIYVMLFYRVNG